MKKLISLLLAALMLIAAVPTLAEDLPVEAVISADAPQPEADPEAAALSAVTEAVPEDDAEAATPFVEPEAAPEAEEAASESSAASEADAESEQAGTAEEEDAAGEAEAIDEIIVCEALDESVAEEGVLDLDEIAEDGLFLEGDPEEDLPLFAAMEAGINGEGFDPVFWSYLIDTYDADGDGALSQAEIDSVTSICLADYDEATNQYIGLGVTDLTGIESFKNLQFLSLENNAVTRLNVSGNPNLSYVSCSGNPLEELTLGYLPRLTGLDCDRAGLTSLDVSRCPKLNSLSCSSNQLSALNLSNCTRLLDLECSNNQLTALNPSRCRQLMYLVCKNNRLAELNLGYNTELEELLCDGNQLTALNIKGNLALYKLTCSKNLLTSLDISGLGELQHVSCRDNLLTSLNASDCEWMYTIDCRRNQLTSIDITNNLRMYSLLCDHNRLTALDLSTCPDMLEQIGRSVRQEKDGVITFSQYHFAYNSASDRSVAHLACDAGVDVTGVDINTAGQNPENGPFRINFALAETSADGWIDTPISAFKGETVRVELYPEDDTEPVGITVQCGDTFLECAYEDGAYTCIMPGGTVKVTAVFRAKAVTPEPEPKPECKPAPMPEPKPAPAPAPAPGTPAIAAAHKADRATVSAVPGTVYALDLGGAKGKGFKSSKKKVATVNGNGTVTIKGAGKTRITFKVGKKKRTVTLTVKDPTVPTSVTLTASSTAVKKGDSVTLTPVIPAGTNTTYKWKSSNKKVATVKNGVVTFKKPGKVTITCTAKRGKKKGTIRFIVQ